jgi:hypothetical protein
VRFHVDVRRCLDGQLGLLLLGSFLDTRRRNVKQYPTATRWQQT